MERSLQIHKLVPVLIEPDKIGLDIEAALTESDEGDEGVDFAVPNVTFEVRIGVRKVYEKKSDAQTGQFVANNVEVGEVEPQFDVMVSATDEVGKLSVKIKLDAEIIMREIEKSRIGQSECEKLSTSIVEERGTEHINARISSHSDDGKDPIKEAEKQRVIKLEIKLALERIQIKRSPDQQYMNDKDLYEFKYFDAIKDCWVDRNSGGKLWFPDEEVGRDLIRKEVESGFSTLVAHSNHPLVNREIINTAKQDIKRFIEYMYCYYEAIWAEDVIKLLAKSEPKKIIDKFTQYARFGWARNVLIQIAENFPKLIFECIEIFEYQSFAEEIAIKAASISPASAIQNYSKYQDQPWAKEVLEFAKSLKSKI